MNPTMQRGEQRYQRFQYDYRATFGAPMQGRLLDFGCGAGAFLLAAQKAGIDVHGVEVDKAREQQFLALTQDQPEVRDRFNLYPGRMLPFPSNHFDSCYSWFVFEHVSDPQISLREITRTLKPGGTLTIHADDTRNAWDGHSINPWPSYLPREFAAAYLDGLVQTEKAPFLTESVVYISAPVICDILTTLGMEILVSHPNQKMRDPVPGGLYVTTEAEARELGQKMRDSGIESPRQNLLVCARKL